MDPAPVAAFDRLTVLAATTLHVPVALISLVSSDRQVFKSQYGLHEPWATMRQTPLSHSFCQNVVDLQEPLIVNDAREHPLVCENRAILDLKVVAYAGVPIFDNDGFVLGSLCAIDAKPRNWTAEDVGVLQALSAQVTVELQLRSKADSLSADLTRVRADDEVRRRIARLNVHDLRTPLSALLMGLEIIARRATLTDANAALFDICKQNGRVLQTMVDNLLDIDNLDQRGGDALARDACRAHDAVKAAVDQVQALATDKGVAVTIDVPEQLAPLSVDIDKLVRVLVNLLGNGIKFTHTGGHVRLSATSPADDATNCVRFDVADDGIGMADASRIFDEGVRLDSNATTRRSTGLGLTFCKRVVEAHNGQIWVTSTPNAGSTFSFTIPSL